MTRDEILNRIAIKKHGRHFNEIFAIKSRAEILQQALDEALEQVNNNAVLHSVVGSAFVSGACKGEKCSVCGMDATDKLGEEIQTDDPNPNRHNLTAYVCKAHFRMIVG